MAVGQFDLVVILFNEKKQTLIITCWTLLLECSVEALDLLLGERGLPRHLLHVVRLVPSRLQQLQQPLVIPASVERLLVEHHVVDPLHEGDWPPLAPHHHELPLDHVVALLIGLHGVLGDYHSLSKQEKNYLKVELPNHVQSFHTSRKLVTRVAST